MVDADPKEDRAEAEAPGHCPKVDRAVEEALVDRPEVDRAVEVESPIDHHSQSSEKLCTPLEKAKKGKLSQPAGSPEEY